MPALSTKQSPKKVSILLVENNPEDIQNITTCLTESKRITVDIKSVNSIKKAKTVLFYEKVDIVILDLSIEGGDSQDLFDNIGTEKLSLPYIVITDEIDEDLGIEAVKKGAQEYLVRSEFSERSLRRAVMYSLERHEILDSLYKTTIIDELTGLYNRRGFYTMCNQQIELAKRHKDDMFVFYLDLDGMKEINDNLGHAYGDKALIGSSKIITNSFRNTDILARIGGDEFIVMAVKGQFEYIPIIIQRIKDYMKDENENLEEYQISMSIGVSKVNLESKNPLDDAIKTADKEMYKAKIENKKNRN